MSEGRLHQALQEVRVASFFLPIRSVGTFGGARPTVVWAGVGAGHPHLFALHKRIQDAVLHAGLEPDLSGFHPHITIARSKGVSREVLSPFLRRYAEEELSLWKVSGFALYSSLLSPNGATYSIEMRSERRGDGILRLKSWPVDHCGTGYKDFGRVHSHRRLCQLVASEMPDTYYFSVRRMQPSHSESLL